MNVADFNNDIRAKEVLKALEHQEYITAKLSVCGSDVAKISLMGELIEQKSSKFVFADINQTNMSTLAWEVNQVAKQFLDGHRFLNKADNYLYSLKYVSINIDNSTQEISFKPYFVRGEKFCSVSIKIK